MEYTFIRSKRRTIGITVKPDGSVIVRAPLRCSQARAEAFVLEKRAWIERTQKSRWGSCSSKGNLNFNCLLILLPEQLRRYVVVHELCHRKEMNHSQAFWREVAKYQPTYREDRKQLQEQGRELLERIP